MQNQIKNHTIPALKWPQYSPDLDPNEMVSAWLKEWVCEHYPSLKDMGNSDAGYQELYAALQEGWQAIPQEKTDHLIKVRMTG